MSVYLFSACFREQLFLCNFKDVYIRGWLSPIYYLSAEKELEAIKQSLYLSAVKKSVPLPLRKRYWDKLAWRSLCPQNLCWSKAGCLPPDYLLRMVPGWEYFLAHITKLCPRIVWVSTCQHGPKSGSKVNQITVIGMVLQHCLTSQCRYNLNLLFLSTWMCNHNKQGESTFIMLESG